MFTVYILQCEKTRRVYVGSCLDLDRRLAEHRRKKPSYRLIYKEHRETKREALRRELYLKTGNGRHALLNILAK